MNTDVDNFVHDNASLKLLVGKLFIVTELLTHFRLICSFHKFPQYFVKIFNKTLS